MLKINKVVEETPPPEWVSAIKIPNEAPLEANLAEEENKLANIENRIKNLQDSLAALQKSMEYQIV